jgi:hypothetical protein
LLRLLVSLEKQLRADAPVAKCARTIAPKKILDLFANSQTALARFFAFGFFSGDFGSGLIFRMSVIASSNESGASESFLLDESECFKMGLLSIRRAW